MRAASYLLVTHGNDLTKDGSVDKLLDNLKSHPPHIRGGKLVDPMEVALPWDPALPRTPSSGWGVTGPHRTRESPPPSGALGAALAPRAGPRPSKRTV